MWGFKAVSGDRVGGGLYATVRLEPDEEVLARSRCWYRRNRAVLQGGGYAVATNRRIIFVGCRIPGHRPVSIPHSEVSHFTSRRSSLLVILTTLFYGTTMLTIETVDGARHAFWPWGTPFGNSANNPKKVVEELGRLLGR